MHTCSSARPLTVKFSPNWPYSKSSRPSSPCQYRYDSIWYTNTARFSPPCPARSPWPSPSMFSRRTWLGPSTEYFQTPVCTVFPCQVTSFGRPTLTERRRPAVTGFTVHQSPDSSGESPRRRAGPHLVVGTSPPSGEQGGYPTVDANQCWFVALLHFQTTSWVPSFFEEAGSSRQYWPPRAFMTHSPLALCVHFSLAPPLQVYRITLLPLPPVRWSLRHLPLCFSWPLV